MLMFLKKLLKNILAKFGYEIRRMESYNKNKWKGSLEDETRFWDTWLATKGECNNTSDNFKRYNDPDSKLQDIFLECIDKTQSKIMILDVGAGPLTSVNKKCDFAVIEISGVDVLADEYDKFLSKYNIHPIVRTQMCDGERLTGKFKEDYFDITCSFNALDHSYDPLKCIEEMIKVTKRGHFVIISVFSREGEDAGWSGLHKWNFFVRKGITGRPSLILEGRNLKQFKIENLFRHRLKQVRLEENHGNRTITGIYKKIL